MILGALKALRPTQWTKQVLVLAALIFSMEFTHLPSVLNAAWAFGAFCLVASTGYIINDIRDAEADRLHPKKKSRPIASGELPVGAAWGLAAFCLIVGLTASYLLSPVFAAIALIYFLNTNLYTIWGKEKVIIDIMMISAGFLLRAVAGAVAIDRPISPWLLLCAGFFSLFLGFNKRRGELQTLEGKAQEHRANLSEYSLSLLDEFQSITTSGTVISYALYTVLGSPTVWLLLTLPFPLYGIFRYIYLVQQKNMGGDPSSVVFQDRPILATCVLYALVAVAVLLLAPVRVGG